MKYWAYLNDEVSQKPYTEEELQQLAGFGPDVLICTETSAVSSEPDWKPARELFPYLIKPKAPDFSKFRPKPPVPGAKNNDANLPLPDALPAGVNAAPLTEQPQEGKQMQPAVSANDALLAQLQSLNEKIASLENKISEQEKELAAANTPVPQPIEDIEPGATFVSEPQNEQEDDVLEVPFDSDFEIPFDVNKSSEEIAKEAEALLAKPVAAEIEEYNADDQNTELMGYASSDMQKILEDTIRQSDLHEEPKQEVTEKKEDQGRTFIAQDLISKTILSLSDKGKNYQKEEYKQEVQQKEDKQEVPAEQNQGNEALNETETKQENDSQTMQTEGKEEEQQEPEKQEVIAQEPPLQEKAETQQEQEFEYEPQLKSLDDLLQSNKAEKIPAEELQEVKPQLVSLDNAPEAEDKSSELVQEMQEENLPAEEPVEIKEETIQNSEDETEEVSNGEEISEIAEPMQEDNIIPEEPVQEQSEESLPEKETSEEREENSLEAVQPAKEDNITISEPVNDNQEEYLKTVSLDDFGDNPGLTEQLKISEDIEDKEGNAKPKEAAVEEGFTQRDLQQIENANQEVNVLGEDLEVNLETDDAPETKTANLSMTQGVSISNDETTAAVLNEIAEEKSQEIQKITTTDKLFEELENTYRNENEDKNNVDQALKEAENTPDLAKQELSDNLSEDLAKEDEFLKTFTTSVEEVFLDQPTAIISDYVPPSDDQNEHTKPKEAEGNIQRKKPSDIKTVPLVPEAMGQEIYSSPYVESATAKLGRASLLTNLVKWMVLILVFAVITVAALSGLAVMEIIPEKLSPIHTVIYSLQKTPQEDNSPANEDLAPEMINQNQPAQNMQSEQDQIYDVIGKIKNYTFSDGTTLEERVRNTHQNVNGQIDWTLFPTEEQNVYSIAVKIPQNADGQGFSYRFNYNVLDNLLTPTTSGARNIMENYQG